MKLGLVVPELILAAACLVGVPLAGWCRSGRWRWIPALLAGAAIVAALVAAAAMLAQPAGAAFHGSYAVDAYGHVFEVIILAAAALSLGLFVVYLGGAEPVRHAPIAILFGTLGGMLVVSSVDLAVILLGLQIIGTAGYLLAGLLRGRPGSQEAALKFFVFGAVALAITAYGFSFLYGLTGSLRLDEIGARLGAGDPVWIAVVLGLVLVGFGFEIAVAPMHFWAPDVLQGASAPAGAFLSTVPKVAALGALLRLLLAAFPAGLAAWPWVIAGLAALTMTLGNLAALRQSSLKRMLAYSSIGQAGYVLMAVAASGRDPSAVAAAIFYLATYVLGNLAAFAVVAHVERRLGSDERAAFAGLARRAPRVAVLLALAMLSLAGIPPLAGFAGKVVVLEASMRAGLTWLAIVAAINWAIALFYYVRVLADCYLAAPGLRPRLGPVGGIGVLYVVLAIGLLGLGILPAAVLEIAELAAS